MFKKIREFGKKPITWGNYGKLCVVAWIISAIIWFSYMIQESLITIPFKEKKTERKDTDTCFDIPISDDF